MALSDSDIFRLHTVNVTGSPAPGFYDTAQNDPAASGIGTTVTVSTTPFTNNTDQNLWPVFSLSQMASGTLYSGLALVNSTSGSPGAIDLTEARVWFTNTPSESGVTVSVAGVGVAGQNSTSGSPSVTQPVPGVTYSNVSNYTSWSTGLKFGTGSPATDRTLSAAKANALYVFFKIELSSVSNQLIKSSGNNLLTMKVGGGES